VDLGENVQLQRFGEHLILSREEEFRDRDRVTAASGR
jgi:hypothetical protein